jgi:biofilm PGA synthesis N-glycosyltransferase PgaC
MLIFIFGVSLFALFWTYCGYPLLMYLWAHLSPRPIRSDSAFQPHVTLLIPAHNEVDVIRRKFENSLELTYPREKLQILIVDDCSDDGTYEIAQEYLERGVSVIRQPVRQGKMAAVNLGVQNAQGEIIVLSDASPNYEPHSLDYLMRSFGDAQVGVVVGKLALWDAINAVTKPAGLYWRYEAAVRKWESQTGNTVAVHGNMFAIRRALYRPFSNITINDEFSLAMDVVKQGFRVVYEPQAISYDDASASMGDEFKRRVRINAGRYQGLVSASYLKVPPGTAFRFISHKLLRSFAPLFMLILVMSNVLIILGQLTPLWVWASLLLAQGLLYVFALFGWILERRGRHSRLISIPYFFVSTNLAALVGLWRWARNSQSVTWQKRSVRIESHESVPLP